MTSRLPPPPGAADAAPHRHHFTLRGRVETLAFPALCAYCGSPAHSRLTCSKVFTRSHSDSPTEHVSTSVEVPFCDRCIALHRAEAVPRSLLRNVLSSFSTGDMLGAVFPGIAAVFVTYLALKDLLHGRFASFASLLVVAAFFGLIAWSQRRHVWRETAYLRVARPSSITLAFDFSDDLAPAFEPPRFTCSVRDERFAAAFDALNQEFAWSADSPQAQADRRASNRKMWIIGGIVAAIALLSMIIDWLRTG